MMTIRLSSTCGLRRSSEATSIPASADDDSLPCTPKPSQTMAGVLRAISAARVESTSPLAREETLRRMLSSAVRFFGAVRVASMSGRFSYVSPIWRMVMRSERRVSSSK
jgi:hypothetical protein